MKNLTLPLFAILFLIPMSASAILSESIINDCKSAYTLNSGNINFVEEKTGHDPRQFLIRRCISTARKALAAENRVERQQVRDASHYDRSAANVMQLRIENENYPLLEKIFFVEHQWEIS